MSLSDAAAEYLKAGWSVIALSGKQPVGRLHPQGLHNAMEGVPETPEDWSLVDTYFNDSETTGIGIVLPEHVVVVDIDGEDGAAMWRQIVGDDDFVPDTPVARTGKGLHLWFWAPFPMNRVAIGPHLDLKGYGGYVAVPPSKHPNGSTYEWIDPLGPKMDLLPAGVTKYVQWLDGQRDTVTREPVVWRRRMLVGKVLTMVPCEPYVMDWRLERVGAAPEGTRNDELNKMAHGAMLDGVPLNVAMPEFLAVADAAGLAEDEARKTIRSAYRAH